ncbi:MAG TPA: carbon storage regulator [Pirellulales bacterium]|nr:carbon storage regulator [Pirellulales bacterium]
MLVVTRKVNQSIQVGDDITITVVRVGQGTVRIGIEAPPHLSILRRELTGEPLAAAIDCASDAVDRSRGV